MDTVSYSQLVSSVDTVSYSQLFTPQEMELLCSCLKLSSVDTVSYSQLEGAVVLFVFNVQFS